MGDALAASDAAVIDCSEGIELLPALGHEGHDHDTEYDPHIWMCEESALVMMNNILHGLGALDEKNLDCYRENAAAAAALVPEDDARMENLACPYLITFHDGFQYFALDNGLNLLKSIEEEEGAEASAAEIQEVVDLVREYEIPAIFTERNGSEATARAISRETGCAVYQLDMIMSGDGTGIQPYLDAMQKNIDTIAGGIGMSVHKHGTTGPGCAGTCCLKATDLGVSFGGEEVLRDVSFHLHCGEIVALIGPNGAGKSSLFRTILGQVPHTGTIEFQRAGATRPGR